MIEQCPFCGNYTRVVFDASLRLSNTKDNNLCFYVTCKTCNADGPTAESYEEAIDKWNDRPLHKED